MINRNQLIKDIEKIDKERGFKGLHGIIYMTDRMLEKFYKEYKNGE